MSSFNSREPEVPDYYADLGILQQASLQDIKAAFRKLARKYHPDKQAPGQSIDAHEFRKVREAYECLTDKDRRQLYDFGYPELCERWASYKVWRENELRFEEARRAEQERQAARAKAEEERVRKIKEAIRATMERERNERIRKEKAKQAEERSREAARKAREQQEQAARDRLRRQKEKEAEKRSEEAARKARVEREQAAQERLKAILIEEKQEASRRSWAKMREAADQREATKRQQARPKQSRPVQREEARPLYTWRERRDRIATKERQEGASRNGSTWAQPEKTARPTPPISHTKMNPPPSWRDRATTKGPEENPPRAVPLRPSGSTARGFTWRDREAAKKSNSSRAV